MHRNGQKRDKKKSMGKDDRKKVFFSLNLFGQKFLTWTFPKRKRKRKEKGTYLPHLVAIFQIYVGFKKSLWRPLEPILFLKNRQTGTPKKIGADVARVRGK
jgi:hypothetical protein